MKLRKHLLLLTILLIGALLTAQCGGAAPAPAAEPAGGEAPAAAEQPAAGEPIKLRLWMHQNPSFIAANEQVIERFKEVRPDVEITLESFPYDVFIQTLQTSMPAGTEADIMQMFGSWVCGYSDRLAEMPDSVMAYAEAEEVFYKAPLDGYYCDGKLYGLPQEYNIENGAVMVNPALFEEAGLTYPPQWESMDDLLADAQKLVKLDGDTMTGSGFHFVSGDGLAFQFLAGILQRGGEYWKPDGSGLNFMTDEARATLEEMKSWVAEDQVTDPFLFNSESNWVGDAFFQNLVGIGFIGPWIVPEGRRQYPEMAFDYVPLPNYAGDEHLFAADAGWGLVVSPNSPQREAAFEFVKFAASQPENARIFNVGTGTVPSLVSVAEDPTLLDEIPWVEASLQVLPYGRYVGPLPDRDLFWYEIVYNNILAVLQDQMTVDQALEAIDAQSNAMFQ
jgi:multiple sugar transport system substrate-binding protein